MRSLISCLCIRESVHLSVYPTPLIFKAKKAYEIALLSVSHYFLFGDIWDNLLWIQL